MVAKSTNKRDEQRKIIGRRIRRRRLFMKMTQASLARSLGITFQQVQKYENGTNKVSEDRLRQISHYLDVSPEYFSHSFSNAAQQADALEYFVQGPEGIALCRAIACIPDASTRASLIMAVEAFCDSHIKPEEAEAEMLASWLRRIADQTDPVQHKRDAAASIHAAKIEVAQLIGKTLKARKMTQKFAAKILLTDQAKISELARGNVQATSFEKLLRYLVLLGWDASIDIAKRPANRRGKIAITAGSS